MTNLCPTCSAAIPADSPLGMCPKCMLAVGVGESEARAESSGDGTEAPPSAEEIQPLFPHLQILRMIGQGGMGAVFEARQRGLGRTVALKLLWAPKRFDAAFEQRFAREGQALAQLSHDNIVTVHDAGKSGPYYWLIMEYVDGANLRELLEQGRLSPAQALPMVTQICWALEYAHQQGIVHRDIKPENILIGVDGRLKVADFGLAKMLASDRVDPKLTQSFLQLGTPHYMAPEQLETPKDVDHRADIYSLGVVLYELLTGELPLGKFELPSRVVDVDPRFDGVVSKAMQKSPSRRYQAISDVRRAVQNIADSRGQSPSRRRRSRVSSAKQLTVSVALMTIAAAVCFFAWQHFEGARNAQAAAQRLEQYYRDALVKVQSPAQRREGIVGLEYVLQQDPERLGLHELLRDACRLRAEDLIQQQDSWNATRSARRAHELAPNSATQSTLAKAERIASEDLQRMALLTSPKLGSVVDASSYTIKGSVPRTIKGEIAINGKRAEKSETGEFHVAIDGLNEGPNKLTLSVMEDDGLVVSMPFALTVDTKAPQMTVTSPAESTIVRTPIKLAGKVEDASGVKVTCEGVTTNSDASGAWSLSLESLPEGERKLIVIATDAAGHRTREARSLVIDNTEPEIKIDGDRIEFTTLDAGVDVRLRVSDKHLTNVTANGEVLQVDQDGGLRLIAAAGALAGESHVTTVSATDKAGNRSSVDLVVTKQTTESTADLARTSTDQIHDNKFQVIDGAADESARLRPIPESKEQQQKIQLLKNAYRTEYDDASAQNADRLARILRDKADSLNNDPVGRFVYLDQARMLWIQSCALSAAWETVCHMCTLYSINAQKFQADTLEYQIVNCTSEHGLDATLDWIEGGLDAADATIATALCSVQVRSAIERIGSGQRKERASNLYLEADLALTGQKALNALRFDPENPRLSLAAGRYLCFLLGDFDAGLKRLAQSKEKDLRAIALKDMAASGKSLNAKELQKIGQLWENIVSQLNPVEQSRAAGRAIYWYEQAFASLTGTVDGDTLEQRLEPLYGLASRSVGSVANLLPVGSVWTGSYTESGTATHVIRAEVLDSRDNILVVDLHIEGYARRRFHMTYRRGRIVLERDEGVGKQPSGRRAATKTPVNVRGTLSARALSLSGELIISNGGPEFTASVALMLRKDG